MRMALKGAGNVLMFALRFWLLGLIAMSFFAALVFPFVFFVYLLLG